MTNKNPKKKFTCWGGVYLFEEYFGHGEIKITADSRVYIDGELMRPQTHMMEVGCEGDNIFLYDPLYNAHIMTWFWKDKTFRLYDGKLYFRYIDDKLAVNACEK